jgi:hypothetical protein
MEFSEKFEKMPPDEQEDEIEKLIIENQHKILDTHAAQRAIADTGLSDWSCIDPSDIIIDENDEWPKSATFEWCACAGEDGSRIGGSATVLIHSDGQVDFTDVCADGDSDY